MAATVNFFFFIIAIHIRTRENRSETRLLQINPRLNVTTNRREFGGDVPIAIGPVLSHRRYGRYFFRHLVAGGVTPMNTVSLLKLCDL